MSGREPGTSIDCSDAALSVYDSVSRRQSAVATPDAADRRRDPSILTALSRQDSSATQNGWKSANLISRRYESIEMMLLADPIGFREPARDFIIDFTQALEPKCVEMISR